MDYSCFILNAVPELEWIKACLRNIHRSSIFQQWSIGAQECAVEPMTVPAKKHGLPSESRNVPSLSILYPAPQS
jgi:hypothetical protein